MIRFVRVALSRQGLRAGMKRRVRQRVGDALNGRDGRGEPGADGRKLGTHEGGGSSVGREPILTKS